MYREDRPPPLSLGVVLPAALLAMVMAGVALGFTGFVAWWVFRQLNEWMGST